MVRNFKKKVRYAGELRRSQILTTYGCGALVDFPKLSVIMSGIDDWPVNLLPKSAVIRERNLEKMLGKEFFYQVSSPALEDKIADDNEEEDNNNSSSVEVDAHLMEATGLKTIFALPAYRFPTWYYCPECHSLDVYWNIADNSYKKGLKTNSLNCNHCSTDEREVKLIPSRFIVACLNGHIDDFPYAEWVHQKTGMCNKPKLKLEYKGTTGGLDSIHVYCDNCSAHTTMKGCMGKDALKHIMKCSKKMPWFGEVKPREWYEDKKDCNARPRVLQRSANNVYYAVNKSALTIPPWSKRLQKVITRRNLRTLFKDIFDDEETEIPRRLHREFVKNKDLYGEDEEQFIKTANLVYGQGSEQDNDVDDKSLRINEYKAFCGNDEDDELFRTESVQVPFDLSNYIAKIKIVKKLREVMVLQGFRRILPTEITDDTERKKLGVTNAFSPIFRKQDKIKWLPAIELFGEGIFIELNKSRVSEWEKRNNGRYFDMLKRHDNAKWIGNDMFYDGSARYVLLHTLSHLLIKQLSFQCGYATASIKEKIYSTIENTNDEMCGILIYTSATDTDGSLGGLAREGSSEKMQTTFENMLQEGSWCSNDPLCIESTGQGFQNLNYASCHACSLLPETSCEANNCLIDRASVVGTPENKDIAYFKGFKDIL